VKTLLWQGHSIDTADEVADTAFELARLLVSFSRVERIDLPAEVDGHATTASLVVGVGMGLGMLTQPGEPDHEIAGSADAIAHMRQRISRLDDAPSATDFRLPDDFTVLDHDITT
jgi:hypothetical protein